MAGTAFIEGTWGSRDRYGDACQKLMRELDEEAAKYGEAVVGEVKITEFEHPMMGRMLRLEGPTEPR